MLSKAVNQTGTGVVIPGVAGKMIRVFAWSLAAAGLDPTDAVMVKWQGTTGPRDLTGPRPLTSAGPVWDQPMAPMRVSSRDAYLETGAGEGLQLALSAPVDVGGFVNYEVVQV